MPVPVHVTHVFRFSSFASKLTSLSASSISSLACIFHPSHCLPVCTTIQADVFYLTQSTLVAATLSAWIDIISCVAATSFVLICSLVQQPTTYQEQPRLTLRTRTDHFGELEQPGVIVPCHPASLPPCHGCHVTPEPLPCLIKNGGFQTQNHTHISLKSGPEVNKRQVKGIHTH